VVVSSKKSYDTSRRAEVRDRTVEIKRKGEWDGDNNKKPILERLEVLESISYNILREKLHPTDPSRTLPKPREREIRGQKRTVTLLGSIKWRRVFKRGDT